MKEPQRQYGEQKAMNKRNATCETFTSTELLWDGEQLVGQKNKWRGLKTAWGWSWRCVIKIIQNEIMLLEQQN